MKTKNTNITGFLPKTSKSGLATILGLTSALMLSANAAVVMVASEATVRDGGNADTDQDEAGAGYVMTKFSTPGGSIRHSYFQFDLSGQDADLTQAATFSIFLQDTRAQGIQVWALDQAYTGFTSTITWNTAQANDTTNNDMLTVGAFTATKIGGPVVVPGTNVGDEIQTNLTSLSPYVFGDKITFVVTGVDDATNDNGGLRIRRNDSELEFTVVPEPSSTALLGLGGLALILRRRR
jgi:hypothetical protein